MGTRRFAHNLGLLEPTLSVLYVRLMMGCYGGMPDLTARRVR